MEGQEWDISSKKKIKLNKKCKVNKWNFYACIYFPECLNITYLQEVYKICKLQYIQYMCAGYIKDRQLNS